MATYQVTVGFPAIAEPIRPVRRGTLRMLHRINARPTLELEVLSVDGTYIPTEAERVVVYENGVQIYVGRVQHPSTVGVGGDPSTAISTRLDCVDPQVVADELFLHGTFPGGTLKAFLQWIVTNYLGAKGVSLDPSQADGPAIPSRIYTYRSNKRVSDGLTDACQLAIGWSWTISMLSVLSARAPTAVAAPFNITYGDRRIIGDVQREMTSSQYANRIIVLGSEQAILAYKDDFTGLTNGSRVTFPLTLMPSGPPPHLPNAGVVWIVADAGYEVAETFGLGSATWIYDPVTNTVTDQGNAGGSPVTSYRTFPLPAGRPCWMIYDGMSSAIAIAENTAEQAPPRGVVERIFPSETIEQATLQTIANTELALAISRPRIVTYETDALGLAPGQVQTITLPGRGITGSYILQEIETRDLVAQGPDRTPTLRHTVTAIEYLATASALPKLVGELYTLWSTDRGGAVGAPPAVTTGVLPPVTEAQIVLSDVTTNDCTAARHGFAPRSPNIFKTFLAGTDPASWQYITESHLVLADTPINDAGVVQHGFAPRTPNLFNTFLSGGNPASWQYITEAHLTLTDTTGQDVSVVRHGFAPKLPNDATKFLNGTGGYSVPAGGGASGITALTGEVTATGPGSVSATIAANAVTYPKVQDISAASKLLGRGSAAGAGDPQEIALGTGLTMSGTALAVQGAAVAMTALTGDVTATGPGGVPATIATDAVTYAKIQNVSAASRLLGRGAAAGAGDPQEITIGAGLTMTGTDLTVTGGPGTTPGAHHTTHEVGGSDPVVVTEGMITLADVLTGDVSSARHGFAPKAPPTGGSALFLVGGGLSTPGWGPIQEGNIGMTDIVTNNTTTAKHGFAPKLPGDANRFFDGSGAYNPLTWTNIPYNAANFSADSGMTWTVAAGNQLGFKYVQIGRTVLVSFRFDATTIGGTPGGVALHVTLPITAADYGIASFIYLTTVNGAGLAQIQPGSNSLGFQIGIAGGWTLGTAYLWGQVFVPI